MAFGSVRLLSNNMLGSLGAAIADRRAVIAFDENGTILGDTDRARIEKNVRDVPGLAPVFERWRRSGTIGEDTGSAVHRSQGYVVAVASVPLPNWMIAAVTPEADAFGALADGRRAAWKVGALAAALTSIVMILSMFWLTKPFEQLRTRAHKLLIDRDDIEADWPRVDGEIGDLARVFLHILRERSAVEASTMQLLTRLQAVLDNASVGIAFTRNKRFELTSRTFCKLLGYEQFEMIGGPARMIYRSEEDYADLGARVSHAFKESGSFSGETVMLRKDGTPCWAQLLGRPLELGNPDAGTIWILEDVTDEREMRERLTWTATHDALTGLINRREFETRLGALVARAGPTAFCTLFIDLDRFKAVNDTAGHAAGDRLLCDLGHIVDQSVRHADTVARLGGDEFAVLLEGCGADVARGVADDIRRAVEQYRLNWEGRDHVVGASIGLVEVDGTFISIESVLRAADAACYAAKRAGRNRVCVHGEEAAAAPA